MKLFSSEKVFPLGAMLPIPDFFVVVSVISRVWYGLFSGPNIGAARRRLKSSLSS